MTPLGLFYDTETTGLPLFSEPSEDPRQPHIVQLAAVLANLETGEELSSMDVLVKPEGWTIPEEVVAIHGITTEKALDAGIREVDAITMLLDLHERARLRIGHNEPFDARIVRIALLRHFTEPTDADRWKDAPAACTQRLSTPILKLPPTEKMRAKGMRGNKSANLREAYLHFTGQPLDGAHSAMADARGCMAVYLAIMKQQAVA